jgi:acyl carrier protein
MIKESVRSYLNREFLRGDALESLTEDQPLVTSGLLDSVATLKLVLFLEAQFDVTIDTADIADGQLDTLSSIETLVRRKRQAG